MLEHIRRWNIWRKRSIKRRWYKFMVLIGLKYPPSFKWTMTKKEVTEACALCKLYDMGIKIKEDENESK